MTNPLAAKLSNFVDLSPAEVRRIEQLCVDVRQYRAKQTLIREGDRPEVVFLLLKGWACRYKYLPDGGRQLMAYLLPGDLCDSHVYVLKEMDHSIAVLSNATVAAIPKQKIIEIFDDSPNLARALWWATLVDEAILREWLVNVGRRNAFDRLAHLFTELWLRMKMVGLVDGDAFDMPLTQVDLGDTLGLTAVHVNRTMQEMRAKDLVKVTRGRLFVPDINRLMDVTQFQANYLHRAPRKAHLPDAH